MPAVGVRLMERDSNEHYNIASQLTDAQIAVYVAGARANAVLTPRSGRCWADPDQESRDRPAIRDLNARQAEATRITGDRQRLRGNMSALTSSSPSSR
jgi:hypothetical protein